MIDSKREVIIQKGPPECVQLAGPDDYITIDSSHGSSAAGSDDRARETCQSPDCEQSSSRRTIFRPQVTVNVYGDASTSSGSLGGSESAAGGSGTVGIASINAGTLHLPERDVYTAQAIQIERLSRRLDELASNTGIIFDRGVWSTTDIRPWSQPEQATSAHIQFSKEFKSLPEVSVSICGADVSNGRNFRVKAYATAINAKGFTIHADTWADTMLHSCEVSWIAMGH